MSSYTPKFDVVIVGATGFTGSLAAEYMARQYGKNVSWAIAGRDVKRLTEKKTELEAKYKLPADTITVIVADSNNRESLAAMVKRTRVVASFAGPFWKIGTLLVEECIAARVHYCDITGESPWVRSLLPLHSRAEQNNVRIVPFCGLDSIPSDLGAFVAAEQMREKHKCACKTLQLYIAPFPGSVSGGTIASMMNLANRPFLEFVALFKNLQNQHYLCPNPNGPAGVDARGVWYNSEEKRFTAPWIMARVDGHVVRRSNALSNYSYGADMRYGELRSHSPTFKGFIGALADLAVMMFMSLLLLLRPLRWLMSFVLPKPGEGPSEALRKKGFFRFTMVAKGESESAPTVRVKIAGDVDPGYTGAAIMCMESALGMALQADLLEPRFGILTPAYALNHVLIRRLSEAGITFTPEDGNVGGAGAGAGAGAKQK